MAKNKIAEKVIVITGASSGIGAATARLLAGHGARVALAARRTDRLAALATEIEHAGGEALAIAADICDERACRSLIECVLERWGRLDVLINNAGVGYRNIAGELVPQEVRQQVEVNLLGTVWCTNAAVAAMRKQGSGHIINIGSVAGTIGLPGSSIYSATKFALDGFSQSLHAELARSGIAVTLVCPGFVNTEFSQRAYRGKAPSRQPGPVVSAEYIARWIARLIEHPQRKIIIPWPYHLVSGTNRLMPGLAAWLMSLVGAWTVKRRTRHRKGIRGK